MKVLPVSQNLSSYKFNFQKIDNKKIENTAFNSNLSMMPVYSDLVSFSGGKSLDLAQTISQLDKYSVFPPDVRDMAILEIKAGNPKDKTLIDIHKDKYVKLNDVETLAEAKAIYPEFKNVLSDSEIEYKPNSFIDDVKNGKNKYFDSEIDLSLQLLQLYWGEGFSLTDLANQFNGRNIQGTMERLNIPRVDRGYGIYLKLSDKDNNERFSREMSERAKAVARNVMERKEGAYIPKGPLSEDHKKNISQGLLKYYSENPERISEMSKRQQEFYENNPVEKVKFSEVLRRAWTYREADSIRKKLSKFMGVKDIKPEELADVSSSTQNKLKEFWKRNPWAAEQFSKCMKKSWQHQKELLERGMVYEPIYNGRLFPKEMQKEICDFARDEIPDIEKYLDLVVLDQRDGQFYECDFVQDYLIANEKAIDKVREYLKQGTNQDKYSDVLSLTIDLAMNDLLRDYKNLSPRSKAIFDTLFSTWKSEIADKALRHETINSTAISDVHLSMISTAVTNGGKEIAEKINISMEEAYSFVKHNNLEAMSKRTKTLYDTYRRENVLK